MSDLKPVEIKSGTEVVILEGAQKLRGIVNGEPYILAVAGVEPTEVWARFPVHVPDGNRNIDVAQHNIYKIGWAS